MQFDQHAVCATIIVSQWSDQRLRQHKSWRSKSSWWSNWRDVGTLYGYLRKGSRKKSQKEISCTEGSISSRSTRILPTVRRSKTSWVQILGWQRCFGSHRHEEGQSEKLRDLDNGCSPSRRTNKATSSEQRPDGIERFPGHAKKNTYRLILPRFRMSCQMAASQGWNLFHIDLKKALLQGQSYDVNGDVVCQLPPEAGHPPYIAARLKKPAYGMKDATRGWWNILDKVLCSYGMVPTRADRCCYVLYSIQSRERTWKQNNCTDWHNTSNISSKPRVRTEVDAAYERMLAPIAGSPATGKSVAGIIKLFADDLFGTDGTEMEQRVLARLCNDFQVGSEDWIDVTFTGQRIRWTADPQSGPCMEVSQQKAIDELEEIPIERNTKEDLHCTHAMHTRYRSLLGHINWMQSGAQFQCRYKFSRRWRDSSSHCQWYFSSGHLQDRWGQLDFLMPLYRKNEDGSWQRSMTVFFTESRVRSSKDGMSRGSLIDFESQKIKKTVLSTAVTELSVSPRIVDGSMCWSCKHSHENWCKEPGNHSKNNSLTWTNGNNPHDFHVEKRSLFRKYSRSCSKSNSKLFNRLSDEGISEGRQPDYSGENGEIVRCWHPFQFENTHGNITWCMTFVHTKEKDIFFLNALKVSLAPTPQEEPFHVMFVRNQRTQEPKEPKVCDWNHLSLSVAVPAKPTSRHVRGLESTQPHFAAQTKTFEHEGQNATKITSALADTCM